MVSESINNSLFHQLAEQLQQQNLEQFQKQILEHQQHQQKVKETEEKLHSYLLYTFIENEVLLPEQTVVSPCLTFFFVVPSFFFFFFQSMAMENQESIFGPENSAPPAQSNVQPQLQEQETKLDDSIDNQQQARRNINKIRSTVYVALGYVVTVRRLRPL